MLPDDSSWLDKNRILCGYVDKNQDENIIVELSIVGMMRRTESYQLFINISINLIEHIFSLFHFIKWLCLFVNLLAQPFCFFFYNIWVIPIHILHLQIFTACLS